MDPHPILYVDLLFYKPCHEYSRQLLKVMAIFGDCSADLCDTTNNNAVYRFNNSQTGLCSPYFLSFSTSVVRRMPNRLAA